MAACAGDEPFLVEERIMQEMSETANQDLGAYINIGGVVHGRARRIGGHDCAEYDPD